MYKKVMVPLDGSELAECVLPHVQKLAQNGGAAEVVLFRVCEPAVILADYPPDLQTKWEDHVKQEMSHIQQQCQIYLSAAVKKLQGSGLKVSSDSAAGKPAETIVDYAVQNQVDLIVMATHGRSGVSRWAFGSTAERVVRSSPVPVMIIRPEQCKVR